MRRRTKPNFVGREALGLIIQEVLDIPVKDHFPTEGVKILDAMLSAMTAALHRGEYIYVNGFGRLKIHVPKGTRRIPNLAVDSPTGEKGFKNSLKVPGLSSVRGRPRVVFKPSRQLMAMLNKDTPTYEERRAMSIWDKEDK